MPVRNVCHCDVPPGGSHECEAHQLSLCMTVAGQCRHECRDPPESVKNAEQLHVWTFQQVTGQLTEQPAGLAPAEQALVQRGRYESPQGFTINFQVSAEPPPSLWPVLGSYVDLALGLAMLVIAFAHYGYFGLRDQMGHSRFTLPFIAGLAGHFLANGFVAFAGLQGFWMAGLAPLVLFAILFGLVFFLDSQRSKAQRNRERAR